MARRELRRASRVLGPAWIGWVGVGTGGSWLLVALAELLYMGQSGGGDKKKSMSVSDILGAG